MIIYDLWSNQPFGLHPYRSKNTLLCINMQVFRKYKRCLHPLHLPSGRIVSPFLEIRTPFWKIRTPFWKMRTPFWKMRTPFWKAACVVSKYQPGCNLGSTKTIRNLLILSCGARGASTLCFLHVRASKQLLFIPYSGTFTPSTVGRAARAPLLSFVPKYR